MDHASQIMSTFAMNIRETFLGDFNPWFLALTFFLAWLSLALTAMHIIGFLIGKVEAHHMGLALVFGTFSFTVFGGAFLWLVGF